MIPAILLTLGLAATWLSGAVFMWASPWDRTSATLFIALALMGLAFIVAGRLA